MKASAVAVEVTVDVPLQGQRHVGARQHRRASREGERGDKNLLKHVPWDASACKQKVKGVLF